MDRVERRSLVHQLERAGYFAAADDVRHQKHPGNTSATIEQIADYNARHGAPGAAAVIREALADQQPQSEEVAAA